MPNVAITIFILNPLALPLVRCIRQLQPPQKHKETLQQALLVDALFCQQKRESSMFPLTMLCSELQRDKAVALGHRQEDICEVDEWKREEWREQRTAQL